ncbi:MAG: metal ABC transporter ATP-binding protein [Cardiobacteriaceae bacterium]|nr:metal ABC transporter ATP-binding protein [Cardiobacteriaceae bacterium]
MSVFITLTDIAYRANGRDILHDINFSISRNQILTIVGPNGAGKSTLLALILDQLRPSRGTITRAQPLKTSFVPQKFHPPADLPITARRFLQDIPQFTHNLWLERLDILHLLDTPLQMLSGGETQRLLLARAMLRNADLIVLDEPAAGIDPVILGDYYQIIRDWQRQQQASVLMVSHDLYLVMAASDLILCLNHHICCQGSPETIVNNPDFLHLLGDMHHPETIGIYPHHHNHSHL